MSKGIKIFGEGKYAATEHQQFVDRTGQLVRHVKGQYKLIPVGEAYAFFYCNSSREKIREELPTIREMAQVPSELELYLYEGNEIDEITNGNTKLIEMVNQAKEAGTNILMHGYYPTKTNKETADEISCVLNQAYQSPLYQSGEQFKDGIIYKEKGEYVFRD